MREVFGASHTRSTHPSQGLCQIFRAMYSRPVDFDLLS